MSIARNLTLLAWIKFAQNLLFWQATWFLFLQDSLSAAEAVLLYAIYDIGTTVFEVPSGYMSDRIRPSRDASGVGFCRHRRDGLLCDG